MKVIRFIVPFLIVVLAYPVWVGYQVWDQSHHDELRGADAIVVLGAAQYDGEPSPVFRARLDQAAYLYGESLSKTIIVTGGKRPGDRFTEAEAGEMYLSSKGIPTSSILGETSGRTTLQSLTNVWEMSHDRGIDTVLLVSDPLHSERIKRIATDLGFEDAFASPASYVDLNRSRLTKTKELVHEVGSILVYEIFDR